MFGVKRAAVAVAVLLGSPAAAQVVQDDWLDPALPDFSTTILVDTTYTIRWTRNLFSWFPRYAPSADVTDVALYFKSVTTDDQIRIRSSVNINETQSIDWLVDIPEDMLVASTRWSFQFRPTGSDAGTSEEVSSPQVVVRNAASQAPTETEDPPESTETGDGEDDAEDDADAPAESSSDGSQESGAPESSSSGSSISGGAIGGIVVGSVAVVVMAVGIFFFWKRKARKDAMASSAAVFAHNVMPKPPAVDVEQKATYHSEAELPGTSVATSHFPPSELDATHGRYP